MPRHSTEQVIDVIDDVARQRVLRPVRQLTSFSIASSKRRGEVPSAIFAMRFSSPSVCCARLPAEVTST